MLFTRMTCNAEIINGINVIWKENTTEQEKEVITNILLNMVYVDGGTFVMGEDDCRINECKPAHKETVNSFKINKYEVTQKEYETIMGRNPSACKGENNPVDEVSWFDCQNFIKRINTIASINLRLPTEAEWEFAARGGNKSKGYKYSGSDYLNDVSWNLSNINYLDFHGSKPIGLLEPNELGLYDMSGNIMEIMGDRWRENYETNFFWDSKVALKGGCWQYKAGFQPWWRADFGKINTSDKIGFRLAM